MPSVRMSSNWPDTADEILAGDQVVVLASITPARGVVLTPLTNFGTRDRQAGTLTAVNTSVGVWKKLERMRRNPNVALAYHTREHGFSGRPEYVLVQGRASLLPPVPEFPASMGHAWERFGGPVTGGPLWDRWLRVWATRVAVELAVERVIVWPDLSCRGVSEVHGRPLPEEPPEPPRPPARGTAPRLDCRRAATRAHRLPHVLLGWVGADGFPLAVPVEVDGYEARGIVLRGADGLVPPGGRRAGLTAHWFARYTFGQRQRVHTGWLQTERPGGRIVYAPHTHTGYRLPTSRFLFRLVAGFEARRRLRGARRAGVV
jgi:nitroimidazol reductase NimA-like FMN-containing flavoprotein (pyridoxamine 5'-phosphate oxidase superfamily)